MIDLCKQILAVGLILALSVLPGWDLLVDSRPQILNVPMSPLRAEMQESYQTLFKIASEPRFSDAEIEGEREALRAGEDACRSTLRHSAKHYRKQLEVARRRLKTQGTDLSKGERHALHCRMQNLEALKNEADMLSSQTIPTAYDTLNAKLDLIQQWPKQYRGTCREIADGSYMTRRWGNVKDIGFREIAGDQEDDIKQAVKKMSHTAFMPPDLDDKQIQEYVHSIAEKVAKNSDLKVPVHIRVLNSGEIDAFALPGGYIFVERGLLEAVEDESELAGVIAHELAHNTARHGAKMIKRAFITEFFYQGAQLAAMIFTDGIAGLGIYYGLEYSFYGSGRIEDLKMLGVSRGYELEADQLGVQYAWKAGYDPSGFMRFFDKMATRIGYVDGATWFLTHPLFYQRMVHTQREIMFMPKQAKRTIQTPAFQKMKKELAPITAAAKKAEVNSTPALWVREQGCASAPKLAYNPEIPVEEFCARVRAHEQ